MQITSRRAILGHLTEKKIELHALMDDDAHVEHKAKELLTKYEGLIKEFSEINVHVKNLFYQIRCEDDDFPENAQGEHLEMSKEDQLFMDRVSESAKLVDGNYSIGLPLKNKDVKMPNNSAVAEQQALNKEDASEKTDIQRRLH